MIQDSLSTAEKDTNFSGETFFSSNAPEQHSVTNLKRKLEECEFCEKKFSRKYLKFHILKQHSESGPFICKDCDVSFKFLSGLKKHNTLHTEKCGFCEKFITRTHLRRHILKQHSESYPFICKECDTSFISLSGLKIHNVMHTKEKLYSCKRCKENFSSKSKLEFHNAGPHSENLKSSVRDMLYDSNMTEDSFNTTEKENTFCDEHLSSSNAPKQHSITNLKTKLEKCEFCKKLISRRYLKIHMFKQHSVSGPFICKECDVSFKHITGLRRHNITHTEKCEFCDKLISRKYFGRHSKQHSESGPFICKECDASFKSLFGLKMHKVMHTKEKFSSKIKLKSHLARLHSENLNSRVKDMLYDSKDSFSTIEKETNFCDEHISLSDVSEQHSFTDLEKKLNKCEFCEKIVSRRYLKIHILKQHSESGPFPCKECDVSFKSLIGLKIHNRVHAKEKPYSCEICEKEFSSKNKLESHYASLHSEDLKSRVRDKKCEQCNSTFVTKFGLEMHNHRHKKSLFKCNVCHASFKGKIALKNHFNSFHEQEKSFNCEICNKKFAISSLLKLHLSTHKQKKCVKCNVCEKNFSSKSTLGSHMAIYHLKNRSIDCVVCNKTFPTSTRFKEHFRTHTEEKPFVCEICTKSFALRSALNNHRKTVHSSLKPFTCNICLRSFKEKKSLRKHGLSHRKIKAFKCEMCDQGFNQNVELRKHLLVYGIHEKKPYFCDACAKGFSNKNLYSKHCLKHNTM